MPRAEDGAVDHWLDLPADLSGSRCALLCALVHSRSGMSRSLAEAALALHRHRNTVAALEREALALGWLTAHAGRWDVTRAWRARCAASRVVAVPAALLALPTSRLAAAIHELRDAARDRTDYRARSAGWVATDSRTSRATVWRCRRDLLACGMLRRLESETVRLRRGGRLVPLALGDAAPDRDLLRFAPRRPSTARWLRTGHLRRADMHNSETQPISPTEKLSLPQPHHGRSVPLPRPDGGCGRVGFPRPGWSPPPRRRASLLSLADLRPDPDGSLARARAFLGSPGLEDCARKPATAARVESALATFGLFDRARDKLKAAAAWTVQRLGVGAVEALVRIAADVAADPEVRRFGAVMRSRLSVAWAQGAAAAVGRWRRGWSTSRMLRPFAPRDPGGKRPHPTIGADSADAAQRLTTIRDGREMLAAVPELLDPDARCRILAELELPDRARVTRALLLASGNLALDTESGDMQGCQHGEHQVKQRVRHASRSHPGRTTAPPSAGCRHPPELEDAPG